MRKKGPTNHVMKAVEQKISKVHWAYENLNPDLCYLLYEITFFFLFFSVPPSVKVDNQLVGCPLGESVTLSCFIETYPNSLSYWLRNTEARGAEEMVVKGG